jgi:hypothetical protein
LLAVPS